MKNFVKLGLFLAWIIIFSAIALLTPHFYEDRVLLSDSSDGQQISWDTGYGFIPAQTDAPYTGKPVAGDEKVWEIKTFKRFTHVKKIKVITSQPAHYWWANTHGKKSLTTEAVSGENTFDVANIELPTSMPADSLFYFIVGVLLFASLFTWLSLESIWLIQFSLNHKKPSIAITVLFSHLFTFSAIWICYPGFWSPFNVAGMVDDFRDYHFLEKPFDLFSYIVFGPTELFAASWSVTLAISALALGTMLFMMRRFYLRETPTWAVNLTALAVLLSPFVVVSDLFIEQNIFCAWVTIFVLIANYFIFLDGKRHSLITLTALALLAGLTQTYALIYLPVVLVVYAVYFRNYKRPLIYLGIFLFISGAVIPYLSTYRMQNKLDAERYERISLLRYPTDLQSECDFPMHDVFSDQTIELIGGPKTSAETRVCEPHLIFHETTTTTHSASAIRREILTALFRFPDLVLSARLRSFFSIVGSRRSTSADWDDFSEDPDLRGRAADTGYLRDNQPSWKIKWATKLKESAHYPYRSSYFALFAVLLSFFLWSLFPATFAVSLIYSAKLFVVFFMVPAESPFYLLDLYILGLIIPLMLYAEGRKRGYRVFSFLKSRDRSFQ